MTNRLSMRLQQRAARGAIALDAQLEADDDQLLALVGPSGSGKTTILRALAGLMPVQEGQITVGDEVWLDTERGINQPTERRRVGFVFQHYALFPHMTALQNVALAVHGARDRAERDAIAQSLLDGMRLSDLGARRPAELSGGERQRVALARALARRPQLLLLDEAFSAVDQPTRQMLYDELARLRTTTRVPIVMVTHDLREARLLADRLCILDAGVTLQSGTVEHVLAQPRNPRVAALVGVRDLHDGVFHSATTPGAWGHLQWGTQSDAPRLLAVDKGRLVEGDRVTWVAAADHVHLLHDAAAAPPFAPENLITVQIEGVRRLGDSVLLRTRPRAVPEATMHLEISSRTLREHQIEQGHELRLWLDPRGIHVMPLRGRGR